MKLAVKLFAGAREAAGCDVLEVEVAPSANVEALRSSMLAACPALAPLLPHAVFAINANYATDETLIPADAELACIPPVSGG